MTRFMHSDDPVPARRASRLHCLARRGRLLAGAAVLGVAFASGALAQDSARIERAQQILAGLGYYNGAIDGVAGPGTRAALQRFQDDNGITPSGQIDDYTWTVLEQRMASGSATAGGSSGTAASAGSEIEQAQRLLAALGYNPGPADGEMGSRTRAAIEAFQAANGLVVDGTLGPATMAALRRAGEASASATAGESGEPDLREAQRMLAALGYGDNLTVDGRMGPATAAAITAFQRAEGLNPSGRLTPATMERLRLRMPTTAVRTDPVVQHAQEWLKLLGYDVSVADGVMGPETVRAISRFQGDENLRRTGTITPETYERMRARAQEVTSIPRENPFIEEAQRLLIAAGYDPGTPDGMEGARTAAAMRAFQEAEGLRVTGTLTLETLNALRGEDNSATEIMDFWSLQRAQTLLRELGYFAGAADGVLGPATATAIARFQGANGLVTTGTLTVETYNLLEDQRAAHRNTVQSLAMQYWEHQFADFPVDVIYEGEPAPLNETGHPMMAEADPMDLHAQYESPPTFAGHYVVLQVNLLSGVAPLSIIVDVKTGETVGAISSTYGVEFRPDSRLIVADPINTPDVVEEVERGLRVRPSYYVMSEEGTLTELRGGT
jgi:peptidoglycan hydrolase-like protein with peptidoglycan-binding domain